MATAFQADAFATGVLSDLSQELDSADQAIGFNTAIEKFAQSFTPAGSSVAAVEVRLRRSGSPTDDLIVEIQTNAAGVPSGTVLGTSASVLASTLTTAAAGAWVRFTVNATVTPSTKHWIAVHRTGALDSVNICRWRLSSANPYASHGTSLYGSGAWSAESGTQDATFRINPVDTKVFQIDAAGLGFPFSNIPRRRSLIRTSL